MSTQDNTAADVYAHLKFISGQDNLGTADANRLLRYAMDDYSSIALSADGRDSFDDPTHTNTSDELTYPEATATVSPSVRRVPLDTAFLTIDLVTVTVNGEERKLEHVDKAQKDTWNTTTGVPTDWDFTAGAIEVSPVPDGSYTVKVYHGRAARHPDVTNTTRDIGIPSIHHFYLILHSCRQLGFRNIDSGRVDVASEMVKWEGEEMGGRMAGGKIREFYNRRNHARPRRLKPKLDNVRTFKR
jgi:hypothetical protein